MRKRREETMAEPRKDDGPRDDHLGARLRSALESDSGRQAPDFRAIYRRVEAAASGRFPARHGLRARIEVVGRLFLPLAAAAAFAVLLLPRVKPSFEGADAGLYSTEVAFLASSVMTPLYTGLECFAAGPRSEGEEEAVLGEELSTFVSDLWNRGDT